MLGLTACWRRAIAVQGIHVASDGSDPGLQPLEIVRCLTLCYTWLFLATVLNDEVNSVLRSL